MCLPLWKQGIKASVYPGFGQSPAAFLLKLKRRHGFSVTSVSKYFISPLWKTVVELSKNPFQCKHSNSNSLMLDGDYFLHSVTVLQQDNLTCQLQSDTESSSGFAD